MIIRICTEDKNHLRVRELCAKRFDGFTMLHGMGCWKGQLEPALVIEIALLGNTTRFMEHGKREAMGLAHDIKEFNDQNAVLIEFIESNNVLV